MSSLDLNCDLAEISIHTGRNFDDKLMPFLSSCNIATGGHAGDDDTMRNALELSKLHGVAVGAHPSYPDRENFGRKTLDIPLEDLRNSIAEQIAHFISIANELDISVHHVKPHGALYNDMVQDKEKAKLIIGLIKSINPDLQLYGLANSPIAALAAQEGIRFIHEGFADRAYDEQTKLRGRKKEGAVLTDLNLIEAQLARFAHKKTILLHSGEEVPLAVETICLHSDTENSVNILSSIRRFLDKENIHVRCT